MTHLNRPRPHATTADLAGRRSPRRERASGRRPSVELISEAVVASYIHDISVRHGNGAPAFERRGAAEPERDAAQAARPLPHRGVSAAGPRARPTNESPVTWRS